MEIKDKIKFYADIFQEAFKLTANEEASVMIVQEIGKDLRQSMIPDNKMPQFNQTKPKNADMPLQPATPKQIIALKKHNLYREGLSKLEAQKIISESIESNY